MRFEMLLVELLKKNENKPTFFLFDGKLAMWLEAFWPSSLAMLSSFPWIILPF